MKLAILILSPFIALFGLGYYDYSKQTCHRYMSRTFLDGRLALFERCEGRLGMEGQGKLVKYITHYTFTDTDGVTYEY